jgi:hypothetical protein
MYSSARLVHDYLCQVLQGKATKHGHGTFKLSLGVLLVVVVPSLLIATAQRCSNRSFLAPARALVYTER